MLRSGPAPGGARVPETMCPEDSEPTAGAGCPSSPVEDLLVRHLPGLRAFVRLRAGPAVRAREAQSDLVQSTCREVLERIGDFRQGGESGFRHWLYTTALRKILDKHDFHTAQKRDVARENAGADVEDRPGADLLAVYHRFASPSRNAIAAEELERVEAAFGELPEDYREVVLLSRVVGLSRSEVAQAMGRSEASVRNLLFRALAQLSRLLARGDSR